MAELGQTAMYEAFHRHAPSKHNSQEYDQKNPVFDLIRRVIHPSIFPLRRLQMFRKIDSSGNVPRPITIYIDGAPVEVEDGEPLAAALLRITPFTFRTTPVSGSARAPYCMMGVCFDCLVEIDGESSMRSCMVRAHEGMAVMRQVRRPDPMTDAS